MAKIFYHGMSHFISRLRYISRYSNCSVNSIKKWYKITIPYFIITLDYLLQTKTTASHETTLELKTKDSKKLRVRAFRLADAQSCHPRGDLLTAQYGSVMPSDENFKMSESDQSEFYYPYLTSVSAYQPR